jgi:hypothetical protein
MGRAELRKDLKRVKDQRAKNPKAYKEQMNILHNRAYALAVKHMTEAMSCHPRISAKMIEEVKAKAVEIRENWDGMKTITIDATEGIDYGTQDE